MAQRRERAKFCSQLKQKNTEHTDKDATISFRVKLILAESRREAVLQHKVEIAAKSARFKTQSDFTELI